jgi:hypothetical protein
VFELDGAPKGVGVWEDIGGYALAEELPSGPSLLALLSFLVSAEAFPAREKLLPDPLEVDPKVKLLFPVPEVDPNVKPTPPFSSSAFDSPAGAGAAPKIKPPDPIPPLVLPDPTPNENPLEPIADPDASPAFSDLATSSSKPGRGVSQAAHFFTSPLFRTEQISHFQLSLST